MTMNQTMMNVLESLRALYSARLPKAHEATSPASPSPGPGKGHRLKTKQELREALQQLKALRHARGRHGNEDSKRAA
jgi:hypothetical protein